MYSRDFTITLYGDFLPLLHENLEYWEDFYYSAEMNPEATELYLSVQEYYLKGLYSDLDKIRKELLEKYSIKVISETYSDFVFAYTISREKRKELPDKETLYALFLRYISPEFRSYTIFEYYYDGHNICFDGRGAEKHYTFPHVPEELKDFIKFISPESHTL